MDFLKKVAAETTGDHTTTTAAENKSSGDHHEPSQAELLSSAKVVADAAKATFQKDQNKVDNAKVAGASADLLDAAEKYGKFDTSTGVGSYLEKAENYLHQYESSHSTTPGAKAPPATKETEPAPATEAAAKPEGGMGGYVKMAEGFMNKEEGSESKSSESGYGDMMKMAGDFLKKN